MSSDVRLNPQNVQHRTCGLELIIMYQCWFVICDKCRTQEQGVKTGKWRVRRVKDRMGTSCTWPSIFVSKFKWLKHKIHSLKSKLISTFFFYYGKTSHEYTKGERLESGQPAPPMTNSSSLLVSTPPAPPAPPRVLMKQIPASHHPAPKQLSTVSSKRQASH